MDALLATDLPLRGCSPPPNMEEKQESAVSSRVEQLKAADLPSALQGLLRQAQSLLKPPSRSAAGAPPAAASALVASRHALVTGVLLLLERAALLAKQQHDLQLLKDVYAQLVSAFLQHAWLWELLLRKHLSDLVQHPGAAQLFAEALSRLPGARQARAYRLWRQQLVQQPQLLAQLPPGLAHVLLEQLKLLFQVRTITLPLIPALEAGEAVAGTSEAGAAATAAAATDQPGSAGSAGDVRAVLREQLPHLLHLLLLITCTEGAAEGAEASGWAGAGGSCRPSLSSMQSAATNLHPPCPAGQHQQAGRAMGAAPAGGASSASGASQGGGTGSSNPAGGACCSTVREGVLRHAVVLIRHLSNPDALHSMLGIQGQQQQRQHDEDSSDLSDGEGDAGVNGGTGAVAAAQARAQGQAAHSLRRRDLERVQVALSLLEVCLDGMLTLPPLAAAVHRALHSQGSSSAGDGAGVTTGGSRQHGAAAGRLVSGGRAANKAAAGAAAAAAEDASTAGAAAAAAAAAADHEQVAAAAAELRHTVGAMLALHRELTRFRLAQQPGASETAGSAGDCRHAGAQVLSLPACQQLLSMLATVQSAPGGSGGSSGADGPCRGSSQAGTQQSSSKKRQEVPPQHGAPGQAPLTLLLMPPQLVVQGLELVRQAVEASSSSGAVGQQTGPAGVSPSWRANLAEQAAAIYASCYQAMWGAKVMQSAEAYQLLLSAARLRLLLRGCAGSAPAEAANEEAEAAAEAALLTHNAVGSRRQRQRSSAHELPGLRGGAPAAAAVVGARASAAAGAAAAAAEGGPPPAKRLKLEPNEAGGTAVAHFLQLFQPPAAEQQEGLLSGVCEDQPVPQQQPQQVQAKRRRRLTAEPVRADEGEEQQQQQQKPARKRIVPQRVGHASVAQGAQSARQQSRGAPAAELERHQLAAGPSDGQAAEGAAAAEGVALSQGKQRVVISKAANMTDEEQEALWEAYIADKEFLAEMLGDSDYQQWYDEAAHPLRQQQRRPGGLEAAWAAVLGGGAAAPASLVQQQLPRSLLDASSSMPWDAAAAASLRLLAVLLNAGRAAGSSSSSSSSKGTSGEHGEDGQEGMVSLLQRAFGRPAREAGARAATRICHISGRTIIESAVRAARTAPAGGSLVLLAAHMLALLEGHHYFETAFASRAERQQGADGRRLVAPPLLAAYAQILAAVQPGAQVEEEEAAAAEGTGRQQHRRQQQQGQLLSLSAAMLEKLLLLPPPVQHMLGAECAVLLRLAVPPGASRQAAVEQQAALLWMLVQQQQHTGGPCGGGSRADAAVALPPDAPGWLDEEAFRLAAPAEGPSRGHALLLGPQLEMQQAAAAELLAQLQQLVAGRHAQSGGRAAGAGAAAEAGECLPTECLLPAADACRAAILVLLAEHQLATAGGAGGGSAEQGDDGEEEEEQEDEEQPPQPPLLLGSAAAVASLAASLCQAGAVAAAELAAQLDAAAAAKQQRQRRAAGEGEDWNAAQAAAGALSLCNQFLEPADSLLQAGCLPPAAQQQLGAACEALEAQLQAVDQLSQQLPPSHPLLAAMGAAMEGAPLLWHPPAPAPAAPGGSDDEGGSPTQPGGRQQGQRRRRRRKRLQDVRNPAVRAMLAEDGGCGDLDDDDLSDLEDFIVCNPERDYESFFRTHFYHVRESDSEGEGEGQLAEAEAGAKTEAEATGKSLGAKPASASARSKRKGGKGAGSSGKGKNGESNSKQQRRRQQPTQQVVPLPVAPSGGIAGSDVGSKRRAKGRNE